jgi:hypothetical protein
MLCMHCTVAALCRRFRRTVFPFLPHLGRASTRTCAQHLCHQRLHDCCIVLCLTGDEPDVRDGKDLRRLALALKVPIITTVAGAMATANALKGLREKPLQHVRPCLSVTVALPGTCVPVRMNTPKSSSAPVSRGTT